MAKLNVDLTKVRLVPDCPADRLETAWRGAVMRVLAENHDENGGITLEQAGAIVIRRFEELV